MVMVWLKILHEKLWREHEQPLFFNIYMFNYYILLLKKTAHCLHGVQHLLDILLLRVQHQPPLVQQLHGVHQ